MTAVAEAETSLDLEKIKARRAKLGMTMEQAAEAAGFKSGRQYWYMLESGQRPDVPLSTVNRIAAALKCNAKDILK